MDYAGLIWDEDPRRVDYAHIYQYCYDVLHKAYTRFDQSDADYQSFCRQQEAWLPEYALFMALKNANGGKPGISGKSLSPCMNRMPSLRQRSCIRTISLSIA